MNKKVLLLVPLMLISSCESKTPKIEIDYSNNGGFLYTDKEFYMKIFNEKKNILTIFNINGASSCNECLNISFSDVEQYALDEHFNIYFCEFDINDENFITDYIDIAEMMKVNNDNGLKDLTYQNDHPVFDGLPCLIYSYEGYIGYNVTRDFLKQIKDTITVKKNS